MSGMADLQAPKQKLDPNIRLIGQVAVATILWGGTYVITRTDWFAAATTLSPGVALGGSGIGGFLPIVFVYAKSIRMQDEFNQRLHFIALGVAFALIGSLSY